MKKHLAVYAVSLVSCIALFSSCNEESDPNKFDPNVVPYTEGTPDRTYLEETATEFLSYIDVSYQQTLVKALSYFVDICDNSTFPDNFYGYPAAEARALARAIEANDLCAASRAASSFSFSLSSLKGLYQYNASSEEWQKIDESNALILRFFIDSVEYNFNVSGSGSEWSNTIVGDDGNSYIIKVPSTLNVVLSQGSNNLMSIGLTSDVADNSKVNVKADIVAANMEIHLIQKANNSNISEEIIVNTFNPANYVHYTLLTSNITVTGNNLCSSDAWRKLDQMDDPAAGLKSMVSNMSSVVKIIERVRIDSRLSDIKAVADNSDMWWDSYDYSNPKALASDAANALNAAISSKVYYAGNDSKVRAEITWEPFQYDEYEGYEEWSVRPVITFDYDKTTYDFESYFGNSRFLRTENQIKSIINAYKLYLYR